MIEVYQIVKLAIGGGLTCIADDTVAIDSESLPPILLKKFAVHMAT